MGKKTIAMKALLFSSSLLSSLSGTPSRVETNSLSLSLFSLLSPLTSPAIGSPLEYSGSSSGSTLLLLPLVTPELELRGLTATFCLGLPSEGGFRSSWMVAPCVRPRLLKMFCVFFLRGGKEKERKGKEKEKDE